MAEFSLSYLNEKPKTKSEKIGSRAGQFVFLGAFYEGVQVLHPVSPNFYHSS